MRSQERDPHFVQASAGETHMDMSEEQFCVEIYRKNGAHPFRGARLAWKFTGKTHMDMSEEPICVEIYRKKCRTPPRTPRLNTGS